MIIPLNAEDFRSALVKRYLQPLEVLQSEEDLVALLEVRGVFRNADIFLEYQEQLVLIVEELGRLLKAGGNGSGFDLSELGKLVCERFLEYGQRLPLSLPQATVGGSNDVICGNQAGTK